MMIKKNLTKSVIAMFLASAITIQPFVTTTYAKAPVYFEQTMQKQVTSGLTYETKTKLTSNGWVDIHVLKMDLNNPNVDLDILRSQTVFGEKLRVSTMVNQTEKAVAGINASFFSMNDDPSDIIGAEYKDGYVVLQDLYNHYDKGVASLIQTETSVLLDFFSGDLRLRNSAGLEMDMYGINKINVQVKPVIFDRKAVKQTQENMRIHNTYKMVVVDGVIVEHLLPLVNIEIPENGYIIAMYKGLYETYMNDFKVGEPVRLSVTNSLGETPLKMVLSGGGKIIENGVIVEKGVIQSKNGNNPRTAVGVTKDQDYLIAMVVDGRGQSIGTTHAELGAYLLEYGAYNAIHYDGGGSSSMVARNLGTSSATLVNKPSDGSERRVVNGLGFITTAPAGTLENILLVPNKSRTRINEPISFTVQGYDEYFNPVVIDIASVTYAVEGLTGQWQGANYIPTVQGEGVVIATYNGKTATSTIKAVDGYVGLSLGSKVVQVPRYGTGNFTVFGTDIFGYKSPIDFNQATYKVENPSLGQFTNGVFKAGEAMGITKVTLIYQGLEATGYMVVGDQSARITDFENTELTTMVFPDTAVGKSTLSTEQRVDASQKTSVKLEYSFKKAEMTQAVYTVFDKNPIKLQSKTNSLGVQVYGDNSGLMFRAKIVDKNQVSHLVTFTNAIDFTGWKKLTAVLPAEIAYPATIERLYVASVNAKQDIKGTVYFDLLDKNVPFETGHLRGYDEKSFKDPLHTEAAIDNAFSLSIFGATGGRNSLLDELNLTRAYQVMNQSDIAIYTGFSNIDGTKISNTYDVWRDQYKVSHYEDVKVIHLATSKKSLYKTDTTQLTKLAAELAVNEGISKYKNVILLGNNDPSQANSFSDKREAELIHTMLRDYKEKTGKQVFFVNSSGYTVDINYHEGIRYVDLNGLWYNAHGRKLDINNQFYVLEFYMDQNELRYRLNNLYPTE